MWVFFFFSRATDKSIAFIVQPLSTAKASTKASHFSARVHVLPRAQVTSIKLALVSSPFWVHWEVNSTTTRQCMSKRHEPMPRTSQLRPCTCKYGYKRTPTKYLLIALVRIAGTDRRHHDVPGVDRAQGRSLPSVVVVTGGGSERTLASCDRSSGLAVPASKVDCFLGSILHLIPSVKHSDSKHEWPLVRLTVNDKIKLYQLCR